MSQANVEKLRQAIDAFNRRDFDAALALLRDGATWEPFLSQTETDLLRGKEQIRAAWESQVAAVDLRAEPDEFIRVGDDKVVMPMRMVAHGSRSEMSLDAFVVWVSTFDGDGLITGVEAFKDRDDALKAANYPASDTRCMSSEEAVRDAIDAINRGDADGFVARTHADFEWKVLEESPLAGAYRGQAAVRAYVEEWLTTFDDVRLTIDEVVELDDHLLVVVRGSGWGKASGVEVSNHFCQLWTVTEGVPTRMREYATRAEALAAVREA